MKYLQKTDAQIASLIKEEQKRQEETLMMIPSENIASFAVEEAVGSSLGNKYAEGYAYKRYYQGQEVVDEIETLTIERAKKLFNVPHANVQPYSGSPANLAVLLSLVNYGETIMGLSLAAGGHLTHGAKASFTGKLFRSVQYEVNKEGLIDYDHVRKLAMKEQPKLIIAGITAYPRIIDWKKFEEIANECGAYLMADISHIAGLVVTGVYPSPVPYAHIITTTTHKTLRGPRGAMILVTKSGLKKDSDLGKKIDQAVFPGLQGGPHINSIAAIAVALKEAENPNFKRYAKQVVENAKVLAAELSRLDFDLVSGGTDSHLILIDLRERNLLGNTVAEACEKAGIVLNRNAVPFDPNPPFYPSGIRLGTPGITSRGMKEGEMKVIAHFIHQVVEETSKTKKLLGILSEQEKNKDVRQNILSRTKILSMIRAQVKQLCRQFPIRKVY